MNNLKRKLDQFVVEITKNKIVLQNKNKFKKMLNNENYYNYNCINYTNYYYEGYLSKIFNIKNELIINKLININIFGKLEAIASEEWNIISQTNPDFIVEKHKILYGYSTELQNTFTIIFTKNLINTSERLKKLEYSKIYDIEELIRSNILQAEFKVRELIEHIKLCLYLRLYLKNFNTNDNLEDKKILILFEV